MINESFKSHWHWIYGVVNQCVFCWCSFFRFFFTRLFHAFLACCFASSVFLNLSPRFSSIVLNVQFSTKKKGMKRKCTLVFIVFRFLSFLGFFFKFANNIHWHFINPITEEIQSLVEYFISNKRIWLYANQINYLGNTYPYP